VTVLPDILFVTHRLPFPPDKGDRVRTLHLLRFLSTRARVHLASLADEPVSAEAATLLGGLCARVTAVPLGRFHWLRGLTAVPRGGTISEGVFQSKALAQVIRAWAADTRFHGAVASATSVAHYLRLPGLERTTRVVDSVDVDSQKWFDYAAMAGRPKSWVYKLEGYRLRKREQQICEWADAVTLVSDREAAMMRELTGTPNLTAVTSGVDLKYYTPAPPGPESGCLFVGALNYLPNVDGITWFARTVWPELRHHRPEAVLRVVGRKPVAAVKELATIPGIELVGPVKDVRPHLATAAVVIAPLRIARGLQNKVLEAMASGKAIVSSPAALAGFGFPDLPALSADEPRDWCEKVSFLLTNEAERRRIGLAGRIYAELHHQWSACLEPFGRILRLPDPAPRGDGS
jgi:sugar transferase (PEP-CTERM/EpsH1 system associated)